MLDYRFHFEFSSFLTGDLCCFPETQLFLEHLLDSGKKKNVENKSAAFRTRSSARVEAA